MSLTAYFRRPYTTISDHRGPAQFAALAGDAVDQIPEAVAKLALGIVPLVTAKSIGAAGIEGVYQGNEFTFQVDTGGRVYYMVGAFCAWLGLFFILRGKLLRAGHWTNLYPVMLVHCTRVF